MIIEKPSASGDRLSASSHRQVAQRRILDQARDVAQLERAELERVDPRQLQAAQADVADAGAERVGDRRDAEALRGRPRDHGVLGAGVDDEILERAVVHLGPDHDLVVHQPEVDGVELSSVPGSISNGTRCPNDRRNLISERDQSALSLWSLFGSRLT